MASQLGILFGAIKTACLTVPGIEYCALYNNQFENEKQHVAFRYPCVLIQFIPKEYRDLLGGVQQYDIDVVLHIGFKSFETDDLAILELTQEVYKKINGLQAGYFSDLGRSGEEQDFDHDNVQVYKQTYGTTGKDFDDDGRPTVSATLTDDITKSLETPASI